MSLAQMLLLRGLVARFWKQPCTRAPVRWVTELHDRSLPPLWLHAACLFGWLWREVASAAHCSAQAGPSALAVNAARG